MRGQRGVGGYGPAALRKALFLPALVAQRYHPVWQQLSARLKARGKPAKVIIVTIMRKLVELAWTLVHTQQFFDPQRGLAAVAAAPKP